MPVEELPLLLGDDLQIAGEGEDPLAERADFHQCARPRCGGAALRETATIDCRVDRMWMWMAIYVPPGRRAGAMMNDPEYARWLPVEQVVSNVDAAACLFERRLLAEIGAGECRHLREDAQALGALVRDGVREGHIATGGLQMQRAAHNVMLLLTRIQDFESRVLERGEIEALDREAILAALLLLARLLAPLTPHIAEELRSAAGNTVLVCDAGWPTLSRPARAER